MGLLDFLGTPEGQGLLAAGFGAMTSRNPVAGIGRGGLLGLQTYAGAKDQQMQAARQKEQSDWMGMQRDWMVKDRARAESDRQSRDDFMGKAFTPQPMMQPSQDPAAAKAGNPYANPDFLFQMGKANNLPGLDQVPMGVKPINPLDAMRARFSPEESVQLQALSLPKKPNVQTFKPGEVVRNMDTGEVVYQAPDKAPEAPSGVREYQFAKDQGYKGSYEQWVLAQKRAGAPSVAVNTNDPTAVARAALSFQKDYRDATKASFTRASAYNSMLEASKDPTGKGDLTMVYSYIKALDPESVVREGEIDLVNANRSIPDRVKGYAQRLATGKSLLPHERQDMLEQARNLSFTDYSRSRSDIKAFRDNAQRLGLDPELYAPDPYQGVDFGPRRLGGAPAAPQQSPGQPNQPIDFAAAAAAELARRKGK